MGEEGARRNVRTPCRKAREVGWRWLVCAACVCLGTRNGRRDPTCGGSVSIVLNFPVLIRRSTPTKMRATSTCIQSTRLCHTVYFDDRLFCALGNAVSSWMFLPSPRTVVDVDTRPTVSKECPSRSYPANNRQKKTGQWTWISNVYPRRAAFVSRESGPSRIAFPTSDFRPREQSAPRGSANWRFNVRVNAGSIVREWSRVFRAKDDFLSVSVTRWESLAEATSGRRVYEGWEKLAVNFEPRFSDVCLLCARRGKKAVDSQGSKGKYNTGMLAAGRVLHEHSTDISEDRRDSTTARWISD